MKEYATIKFDSEKSPIGYMVGLIQKNPSVIHYNFSGYPKTIHNGFLSFKLIERKEWVQRWSFASEDEHINFMKELKEFYSTRNKEGLEKLIDFFRIQELNYYIDKYEHIMDGSSSQRWIKNEESGFFILFHERAENELFKIMKSSEDLYTTKSLYQRLNNAVLSDFVFRKVPDDLIYLIKNNAYDFISLQKKKKLKL
jgi:hypothetical protein